MQINRSFRVPSVGLGPVGSPELLSTSVRWSLTLEGVIIGNLYWKVIELFWILYAYISSFRHSFYLMTQNSVLQVN